MLPFHSIKKAGFISFWKDQYFLKHYILSKTNERYPFYLPKAKVCILTLRMKLQLHRIGRKLSDEDKKQTGLKLVILKLKMKNYLSSVKREIVIPELYISSSCLSSMATTSFWKTTTTKNKIYIKIYISAY